MIWATHSTHLWPGADEKYKPIAIKAGALGRGLPFVELVVSPQHHVLIRNELCQEMFGHAEVLAPAKGLTEMVGVRWMRGKKEATYFHLLLAKHALLRANGAQSESFYPGPTGVAMLSAAQRETLFDVLPALRSDPDNGYGPTVRAKITRRQAEKLVAEMAKVRGDARQPEYAA